MAKSNSITLNLPRGSYKRIGELAGVELGKPVAYHYAYACITCYPEKPYNVSIKVFEACVRAALQIIKEEKDKRAQLEKEVDAALPKHVMALSPIE